MVPVRVRRSKCWRELQIFELLEIFERACRACRTTGPARISAKIFLRKDASLFMLNVISNKHTRTIGIQ